MKFKWHNLLGSRIARQSFLILMVGLLLIASAAISVFSFYLLYGRHPVSQRQMVERVVKVVTIAQSLPISKLPRAVHVLSQPGLIVRMTPAPWHEAQIIQLATPKVLRDYVVAHPYKFVLSVQLANGQWLNVRGHRVKTYWVTTGAFMSGIFLLLTLTLLCYWVIKRLALPLVKFRKAAERFGVDMQAPPLALEGPAEMQEVITSFNGMQSRIRRLMHDRTQMLAAISHDLRTPITRLQLRAEYLEGTPQYEKALADLREMEQMIASILSFARDYNEVETMERFDLNALLESLCNDLQDVGHDVVYQGAGERTPYFGRISALKRALINMVENGVKYGDKASVSLKVLKDELQVVIRDEGPGIPEEEKEKVFTPFYRVDSSRSLQKAGTGLGLAVARDIVRGHGGDIVLRNHEEKGLVVRVLLPAQNSVTH